MTTASRLRRLVDLLWDTISFAPSEKRVLRALERNDVEDLARQMDRYAFHVDERLVHFPPHDYTSGSVYANMKTKGWTLLIRAAALNHLEAVEFLLERGAEVNLANERGRTAAAMAAVCGNALMLSLLESKGANLNVRLSQPQIFLEDGYVAPTARDTINSKLDTPYTGGEYAARRAKLLNQSWGQTPVAAASRARF